MPKAETLQEFYKTKMAALPGNVQLDIGHFNVFRMEDCIGEKGIPVRYSRREFYKISLIRGKSVYHYADKSIETSGSTLMFFNPMVPYSWEMMDQAPAGFFCIFREGFFNGHFRGNPGELPVFTPGGTHTYQLHKATDKEVSSLFDKMIREINSDYRYKYDLIRSYVHELIHLALKLEPSEKLYPHTNANSRLSHMFLELLERQFPIESPSQRFIMRSAKDFAEALAVHVNHLNRAVRITTGKTTSRHIFDRLTSEAIALLKHTNWNISEISYCLGFEEPPHFNNFFKKQTGKSPGAYR